MTPEMLLRGLAKFIAVVAVAALGGLALGTALAKLSGNSDSSTGTADGPTTTSHPTATPAATTATVTTVTTGTTSDDVLVLVVSAILHPASSPSGKQRQRARLSVHVRVTNRSRRRLVLSRPVLVSGNARVKTDPRQDTLATNLQALAPGASGDVTLRFETAGTVTTGLQQELRARLTIAGKHLTARVQVGNQLAARR